jgi:hypothetical protein
MRAPLLGRVQLCWPERMRTRRGTAKAGRRLFTMSIVVATTLGMLFVGGIVGVQSASAAATAPAAAQCDPPAFPTGAGFEVNCTIGINNTVSSAGVSSSTVTATACLAAAGVLPPNGCTTTVTTSNQLVTSVDQCNGIVTGGGSNVTCAVSVTNSIVTGTAGAGVTVNQCIGSGTGGGTQPTTVCAPVASTTGATVTQCNGSGNGGGASTRVQCNVVGASTALPLTINQCNGSANGGGSTVTCTATYTNNFVAAATPTPTTTPTTPITPTGNGVASIGAGSGVTGTAGSAPGAGGTASVIPVGGAQTGLGGAARASDDYLLLPGVLALLGAALALTFAARRRRGPSITGANRST